MDSQVERLQQYFTRIEVLKVNGDDGDDFLDDGEYWEFIHPEKIECWSLTMIPCTEHIAFCVKYMGMSCFLPLSYNERVKDVVEDISPTIKIHCQTAYLGVLENDQYNFTIHFDSEKIPFRVTNLIESLETTSFEDHIKELEEKVNERVFLKNNGDPISGRKLCEKVKQMFQDFAYLKTKIGIERESRTARTVSLNQESRGGSQISSDKQPQEDVLRRGYRNKTPSDSRRPTRHHSNLGTSSQQKPLERSGEQFGVEDIACDFNEIPESLSINKKPDYEESNKAYKRFWTACTDVFLYKMEKKELPIEQLIQAPATLNIRSKEDQIVEDMMHWLVNMPDHSNRQTLCVMPVNKPRVEVDESWDEIKGGEFYIINEQHSVWASKLMQDPKYNVASEIVDDYRAWSCYIV